MNGRIVRTPEGYSAFVPDPLPPELTWTPGSARALSEADRSVGRLAGEGRRLPNPHLLIRPFIRREAVLSSRIEGTQASLGELLAARPGGHVAAARTTSRGRQLRRRPRVRRGAAQDACRCRFA